MMSMIDSPDRLNCLWDLLDQETAAYQVLLQDLREEWGCLKKDDSLNLPSLLQAKAVHINQIRELQKSLDEMLSKLLVDCTSPTQKTILDLIPLLSISQANRIRNYRKKMNGLREEIFRVNEKNKQYIQEVLDYLKGLFSLLTSPALDGPIYIKDGRKVSPPLPPSWMSKEV
jgi:hypothetical protein